MHMLLLVYKFIEECVFVYTYVYFCEGQRSSVVSFSITINLIHLFVCVHAYVHLCLQMWLLCHNTPVEVRGKPSVSLHTFIWFWKKFGLFICLFFIYVSIYQPCTLGLLNYRLPRILISLPPIFLSEYWDDRCFCYASILYM